MTAAAQPRSKRLARIKQSEFNALNWTWTAYTRNGRVVASNSGFDTKAAAVKAVRREYGADIPIKFEE